MNKHSLRFRVDCYSDLYTLGHVTRSNLTGLELAVIKAEVEGKGGRVVIHPVRTGSWTETQLKAVSL